MKHPNRTFKNIIRDQLISHVHDDKLWCFCYQYSVWMVFCLINCLIGTTPTIPCFKVKYKIKLWEMIIWGCKVYVVNSKDGKKSLDPRTSTYPRTFVGPLITDNIPHQSDGYFTDDSKIINFCFIMIHTQI